MYVKMVISYGGKERYAYYRKQGIYCFDFVFDKDLASNLTEEEAAKILRDGDWYVKQYGAVSIGAEE